MSTIVNSIEFSDCLTTSLFRLTVSEDGKKALIQLSGGDMRRVINVLQSTWMAYGNVTEENVYTCVGHPQKNDIQNIVGWLLGLESFQETYNSNEWMSPGRTFDNLI